MVVKSGLQSTEIALTVEAGDLVAAEAEGGVAEAEEDLDAR